MATPPAEQSQLVIEFVKVVPVIAGALLAMLGGAITQYVTYWLNGKRERSKLLREKAEALVQSLYEHSDWLSEKNNKLVYSNESHDVPSPLDKAWMIQKLYFPELREPLSSVAAAAAPLVQFTLSQRMAQLKDREAWIKTFDHKPYTEMYRLYLTAFEAAIEKVSVVTKTHVKS
jgi:hypothetical protein